VRELSLVANREPARKDIKVRVPRGALLARIILSPLGRILLVLSALVFLAATGVFGYYWIKYARLVNEKLMQPFANTAKVLAAPKLVAVGDPYSPADIALELRRAGYTESRGNLVGSYQLRQDSVEAFPGPEGYADLEAVLIRFADGKISRITSLQDNTERSQCLLEPQLITNLSERNREKRRLVQFADIPKVMVDAVISAEDKRFFQHLGFDPIRIVKAVYVDIKERRKDQGASTLSQQLARSLWLELDKRWSRKLAEMVITFQIEQRMTKQDIFQAYANEIYLGWRGAFQIHGFGEAAQAFFGKDLSQITLPEAATLAGMIQRPAFFDPFKHPGRTRDRRNLVLSMMRSNGLLSDRDYAVAVESPLVVARGAAQSVTAPYFVDLVSDFAQTKFEDSDLQSNGFRIYTSLDMDLQRAATEAVRDGMQKVDEQLKKQRRHKNQTFPDAQVALVAMDPHSGEIKALVGGRNYGLSQLNHVLAKRQPGSIFKPFVYAAALDTAVEDNPKVLTASTTVVDEPTTFWFDGKPYEPGNFDKEYYGPVTLRRALAKSMNIATVKVAEMVGYDAVVAMANRAGMNYKIKATPAVALGAYEITPVEAAGAYTMFANEGRYVKPSFVNRVRTQDGKALYQNKIESKQVLDPRVAYLTTSLMEEVMRSGTGAGIPGKYGINVPLAGKTGTSRDGWFAGFSSELLCVVWVGFDDNRELNLQGAHSAAPIWGQFMKEALKYRAYRNVKPFRVPDGIVSIDVDAQTGYPAAPGCPQVRSEVFIAGSQPVGVCPLHGGGQPGTTHVAGWDTTTPAVVGDPGPGPARSGSDPVRAARRRAAQESGAASDKARAEARPPEPRKEERKGFLQRLWGVFK
jgi:penicillin-binding protein 1B